MKILKFILQAWPIILVVLGARTWIGAIFSVRDARFTAIVVTLLLIGGTAAVGSWLSVPDVIQRLSGRVDPAVARRGVVGRRIFFGACIAFALTIATLWAAAGWLKF